jgi:hypothetical protein
MQTFISSLAAAPHPCRRVTLEVSALEAVATEQAAIDVHTYVEAARDDFSFFEGEQISATSMSDEEVGDGFKDAWMAEKDMVWDELGLDVVRTLAAWRKREAEAGRGWLGEVRVIRLDEALLG